MTDLQKARADYIAALERSARVEAENFRLTGENQELRLRVASTEARLAIAKTLVDTMLAL